MILFFIMMDFLKHIGRLPRGGGGGGGVTLG